MVADVEHGALFRHVFCALDSELDAEELDADAGEMVGEGPDVALGFFEAVLSDEALHLGAQRQPDHEHSAEPEIGEDISQNGHPAHPLKLSLRLQVSLRTIRSGVEYLLSTQK